MMVRIYGSALRRCASGGVKPYLKLYGDLLRRGILRDWYKLEMEHPQSSPPKESESATLILGVVFLILLLAYALWAGAFSD